MKKWNFQWRFWFKNLEIFLIIFKTLDFLSKRARFCWHVAEFCLPKRNHSSNLDELAFFNRFQSVFSKISRIFMAFSSPSLLAILWDFLMSHLDIRIHRKFLWIYSVSEKVKVYNHNSKNSESLVKYVQVF